MIIEVTGIHEKNKGALLMLEAVVGKLRSRFPMARIAVPITLSTDLRLALGLWSTVPHDWGRFDLEGFSSLIPRKLRRPTAIVRQEEVDVLLDASGFSYGEFWGMRPLRRRLLNPLRRWKSAAKTAILLPQALGPFETSEIKNSFIEASRHLDLLYARDKLSLRYIKDILPDLRNVRLAPDFTNLLHPELPGRLAFLAGFSIVIPNEKVLKGSAAPSRQKYLQFLALSVRRLREANPRTALLIHEGRGDREIADEVNTALKDPVQVIDEASPLHIKAIIGSASIVVSSRFHGLVSALSSGVPSLACGWSHKYEELLGDYGCAGSIVNLRDEESWDNRLDTVLRNAGDPIARAQLQQEASRQRSRAEAMWQEVFDEIIAR